MELENLLIFRWNSNLKTAKKIYPIKRLKNKVNNTLLD